MSNKNSAMQVVNILCKEKKQTMKICKNLSGDMIETGFFWSPFLIVVSLSQAVNNHFHFVAFFFFFFLCLRFLCQGHYFVL